jgi:hypothetical protein
MATITHRYDLPDYAAFMNIGFELKLPDEVLKSVSDLAELVGAPSYVKTPVFPVRNNGILVNQSNWSDTSALHSNMLSSYHVAGSSANSFQSHLGGGGGGGGAALYEHQSSIMSSFSTIRQSSAKNSSKPQQIPNSEWDNILAFQKTELQKKEGIEARMDSIRSYLNKLTDKTYDAMLENLNNELNEIFKTTGDVDAEEAAAGGGESQDDREGATEELNSIVIMNRVAVSIFNTASSNAFYSAIYARLFKDLMGKYSVFKDVFDKNLSTYMTLFETIEYCDPKKNYDKFCDINKSNEKRKSMSLFIVNLMKIGIVDKMHVLLIMKQLQELLYSNLRQEGKTNEVDELSENLFIIVKSSHANLKDTKNEPEIVETFARRIEQIVEISKLKIKSKPSITNKTIFKHLDMLDEIAGKSKK